MKADKIKIQNLEVFANHGVFPEENVLGQKFVVSAELYTDTRKAGQTDELTASIHYGEVSAFIDRYLKEHTFQLLERVAESLAEELLMQTKGLQKIRLEIKKPWAPVALPLETVSVEIEREWHTAYIALGSNIGDSEAYLKEAIDKLDHLSTSRVEKVSSFLVTAPYGVTDQPDFLNGCLKLQTLLYPEELLRELNRIEQEAGRERIIHWGPRTLDLDILFYDQEIIDMPDLHIPHIDLHNRDFVLVPMNQIAPYLRHPVLNQTISQLLDSLLNKSENTAK